ncbi:MAG: septation protein A [Rhizobacter sp.]|jgi:intracellular septation protein|nr:septation protein A [Rhizobacter sp.]HOX68882.1 septation protein A [Burkholderiaceae bacterium]
MKLLLDFLPIILFFGTYKYAESHKDWAAAFATEHFGFIVSGGIVGAKEAPVLLSTVVVIVATFAQIAYLYARGRKIDTMLWVSLGLVVVLGGATIWFHNEEFIKWKPTVLYWAMALALWSGPALFGRNLLQKMMGDQVRLPAPVWSRLNVAWIVFFFSMGVLNRYVAWRYSTDTWVNFKLFGSMGLMILFMVAQGFYLSRHLEPDEAESNLPPR